MKKQEKLKYFKNKIEQEIEEALYLDDLCYTDYQTTINNSIINSINNNSNLLKEELQK